MAETFGDRVLPNLLPTFLQKIEYAKARLELEAEMEPGGSIEGNHGPCHKELLSTTSFMTGQVIRALVTFLPPLPRQDKVSQ